MSNTHLRLLIILNSKRIGITLAGCKGKDFVTVSIFLAKTGHRLSGHRGSLGTLREHPTTHHKGRK